MAISANSLRPNFKGVISTVLTTALSLGLVVGLPVAHASLGNDPTTYLDENFNQTGYATFSTDVDSSAKTLGVTLDTSSTLSNRRVLFTLENSRVILRAFKPSNFSGQWFGWVSPSATNNPSFGYSLDTTFGTAGKLDLGIAGVQAAALPSLMLSVAGDNLSSAQPWIVVSTSTSNLLFKLSSDFLATCGTQSGPTCTLPTPLNITAAVSSAGHAHSAVNVATTANISLSGLQTIDGVTLVAGNRVLVKDQTNTAQNGIYTVPASGAWTRASDYDSLVELQADYRVFVTNGSTYANTVWDQTQTVTTFGTDPITWTQLTSGVSSTHVTGFSHAMNDSTFFVSGATRSTHSAGADKPFFVEITSSTGAVAPNRSFVFSDSEFNSSTAANGFLAPALASFNKFVPASNGLQMTNNTIFIAGSLEKTEVTGPRRIGVIYARNRSDFTPASSNPQVILNPAAHSTSIDFMTNAGAVGGSYKETAQDSEKPFMAAINTRVTPSVYVTYRLQSTGAGNLLSISHAANNTPVTYPVIAIASDGGNLRAYTWTALPAVSDSAPSQTEIISIPGVAGSVSSGVIVPARDSAGNGMTPFVTFNNGTIAALSIQSRTLQPALTLAPVLEVSGWPRLYATQGTRNSDLGIDRTLDFFACTSAYAGSSTNSTTTATPSGCTDLSSSLTRNSDAILNGTVDLSISANLTAMTGFHIVGRLTYSSPNFIYWTASMDFTNGIPGRSPSTPPSSSSSSLTSPAVSSVSPLRGGAQISFTAPVGNPAGTTYRVTALLSGTAVTTATASTSPITVGGLQDGVSYTYRIQAIGPTGTVASAGATSSAVSTLQPGSADTSYFSSSSQPSATGITNTVVQASGNIYVVSTDVRRILPTGSSDAIFGTSGTYSLPGGLTGTVVDVVEDPATGSATPSVYVLVKETSTNDYKVVKLSYSGVLDTSFGTSGVFTPSSQPTAPANALGAQLTIGQSGPVIEIPGVDLPPAGTLGTNFVASDSVSGPAGSPLAGTTVVVGLADGTGGSNLVVSVLQTTAGTTSLVSGFNSGSPVTVTRTSGTTVVGGVSSDAAGNIYVLATINGETSVLAYTSSGVGLTSFGTAGKMVITGASDARGIEVVGERILITTNNGTNTSIRALYTPAGFSALTAAVSSGSSGGGGSGGSGASAFTGPVITSFSLRDLPSGATSQVTLAGERLSSVTSLTLGALSIPFTRLPNGQLSLIVPALPVGTYDLVIGYEGGSVVTHQAAFRILAASTQTPGSPGTVTRSLRFTNFSGDNATLPRSARVGIERAIKSFSQVDRVVCRGYTSGLRSTPADQALALRRAQAACDLIKELSPTALIELRTSPAAGVGPRFRSVGIFLANGK